MIDYANVIKSDKKHRKERKTKNQLFQRIGRKYRLIQTSVKQNNDQPRIMRKLQFRSSFN